MRVISLESFSFLINEKVNIGIQRPGIKNSQSLGGLPSSFQAELIAINFCALRTLQKRTKEILMNISISWVPAYEDIKGNEEVDRLAKKTQPLNLLALNHSLECQPVVSRT